MSAEPTTTARRDIGIVFLGDSLVVGVGDPKGQGWVTRVIARSQSPEADLTAYNLGVRAATSSDVLDRYRDEVPARFEGRGERRLVVSVGGNDVLAGTSVARHRLNLATILDEAMASGVAAFVVGPPPGDDALRNAQLEVFVDAQADVCARRGVPFVDCFRPLLGHDQWESDLAVASVPRHPGQAGYGLMAWLVLNGGWREWLDL
ncbi:GDSL-type esterase/lipase family protein [Nostocoides sp.]|uniref:GDSL-type esterase/lipase family protein n=1 Tax=Nostocoides sp. TaxID=1917966 RepID=UPI002CB215DC|nr:GDSL-type esterase/lipase family protein [Tetrasphaera sp.]